jgi:hypothetical protein
MTNIHQLFTSTGRKTAARGRKILPVTSVSRRALLKGLVAGAGLAAAGPVSHVVHDHTSILRLVETKWNLPALTYRDANASNLLDCLNFKSPAFARPPTLMPAPAPTDTPACYAQDPTRPV